MSEPNVKISADIKANNIREFPRWRAPTQIENSENPQHSKQHPTPDVRQAGNGLRSLQIGTPRTIKGMRTPVRSWLETKIQKHACYPEGVSFSLRTIYHDKRKLIQLNFFNMTFSPRPFLEAHLGSVAKAKCLHPIGCCCIRLQTYA